jgi:anti-sigma B factor antagonist
MTDLTIRVREVDGVAIVEPSGFINAHTVKHFETTLEDLVGTGKYSILLKCTDLNYISSAGLGAIMGQIETVRENGGDIMLSDLQRSVFLIFDTLGFTQLYRVFESEADALQAVSGDKRS